MPTKPPTHNPLPPFLQARVAAQRAADKERRVREYNQGEQRRADIAFYASPRWRKASKWFLSQPENRLCVECKAKGITKLSAQTDHIIPRKERPDLAWEVSNWQGLCRACHTAKTRRGE